MAMIGNSSCTGSRQPGYSGEDIHTLAEIVRDSTTGEMMLVIKEPVEWQLYAGTSVDKIDPDKEIARGDREGRYKIDIPPERRYYFQLHTTRGSGILAERHLPLKGGFNFRDLGGFRTTEGRYVKWGKVFRSDELNHLTDEDLSYLDQLPLISVVDFRSEQEMEAGPDRKPASVEHHYKLSITPGNLQGRITEDISSLTASESDSIMAVINEQLVMDTAFVARYKEFFRILQEPSKVPLVFHYTAGKDCTGIGAYLFLSSLGVEEKVIMEDYLASNTYLAPKYGQLMTILPSLEPLLTVQPHYLQAGIDQIKKEFYTVGNYLERVLKVDTDRMKELYLYESDIR
ncbi:MAG: tyrosine-protein phosphatase [Bacteroides sp.]|nr:tyrosine-protein phosphatase [Bacteroides sp.]